MAINVSDTKNLRSISMEDMVKDAVERKDIEALRWLEDKSREKTTHTRKDGTTYSAFTSIVSIRAEYLRKYYNYVPMSKIASAEKQKEKKRAAREEKRASLFSAAFSEITVE